MADKIVTIEDGEKVAVDATALHQVLQALMGPPHLIRELQVLVNSKLPGPKHDPIGKLIDEYNAWHRAKQAETPNNG